MRVFGWWVRRWVYKSIMLFFFLCAVYFGKEAVRQAYLDRLPWGGEWTEETHPHYDGPTTFQSR